MTIPTPITTTVATPSALLHPQTLTVILNPSPLATSPHKEKKRVTINLSRSDAQVMLTYLSQAIPLSPDHVRILDKVTAKITGQLVQCEQLNKTLTQTRHA